jgi:hypothetical protein
MAVLLEDRLLHGVETRARKKTCSVASRPHPEVIRMHTRSGGRTCLLELSPHRATP